MVSALEDRRLQSTHLYCSAHQVGCEMVNLSHITASFDERVDAKITTLKKTSSSFTLL